MNTLLRLRRNILKSLNQRLINALKNGIVPWFRPWNNDSNAGFPSNILSKKRYCGINPLLLQLTANLKGYHSRHWGTCKQWESLGGITKAGEVGTSVSFYKTLFNAEQIEGVDKYCVNVSFNSPNVIDLDFTNAINLIKATKAKINHCGNRAYYTRPFVNVAVYPTVCSGDEITIPLLQHFADPTEYYITVFHEIAHWSDLRLGFDWKTAGLPMCELIAEIVSCQLGAECGITNNDWKNHDKYLESWLEAMNADVNWIFKAAKQASKITDFVLSLQTQKTR